jgi:DNA-binding PadR family transcriptional regulator
MTGGLTLCRVIRMPRLTLETLRVLGLLLESPNEPKYGLELAQRAGLKSGTIYPLLARLERAGWLISECEDVDPRTAGRRPRRYYKLTGAGETGARAQLAELRGQLQGARPAQAGGSL